MAKLPISVEKVVSFLQSDSTNSKSTSQSNDQTEQKKKKKQLNDQLEYLSKLASYSIDDEVKKRLNLEYLDKDDTTDEQIKAKVEEKSEYEKAEKTKQLTDAATEKIAEQNKKAEDEKVAVEVDKQAIDDAYEEAKQSANNQAIKRGIGRSSIIFNMLKDYDIQKLNAISQRENSSKQELEQIDSEIESLNEDLKKALSALDMQTAIEINDKIDELKSARDKKNTEVIKHNNDVNERLAKYRDQLLLTQKGQSLKNQIEQNNADYNTQMFKLILSYYDDLSYEEMQKDFLESRYDQYLNDATLKALKNYIKSKEYA
ncbi:MAG: hypothetical protein IJW13_00825 [Clostridia bacterium]|nr:hypothetical protein [Clostridia bacterium]